MTAGPATADVVVVGAGHNGLICAAYLARAGINTLLLEARDDVGGCASTVSDLGARFNICSCDHTLVRAMPIAEELDLETHGLHYLESEANGLHLFHDRSAPWLFFHEAERTIDALSRSYPAQVSGYRRYLTDALPVAELVIDIARTHPSAPRMMTTALARRAKGAATLLDWSRASADDVFARYFDDWHVTMPAIAAGPTVWGVPPSTPGTGLAALAYATRHLVKTGRPAGGSGALTDATRRSFETAGGRVRCGAQVTKILLKDGEVRGVRLSDGAEVTTGAVVAACDPHRVMVDWIDEPPPAANAMIAAWRDRSIGEGYESKLDAVLSGMPRFADVESLTSQYPDVDLFGPTATVCPSPDQLAAAHADRAAGKVADCPTLLINVPSAVDPAMVPEGGQHVLSLEVLFTPYKVQGGWPQSPEPQRWIELWAGFSEPGAADLITRWRAMTPDRYESEFSMHRGYTPAYAGSPLSALLAKQPELTRYRTAIDGLYLSGAGTFPGAGIFGAAGRNTADVVRRDLHRGAIGRAKRRLGSTRRRAVSLGGRAAGRVAGQTTGQATKKAAERAAEQVGSRTGGPV